MKLLLGLDIGTKMHKLSSSRRISSPQNGQLESGSLSKNSSGPTRFSFHRPYNAGFHGTSYGMSPKSKIDSRYSLNNESTGLSYRENSFALEEEATSWDSKDSSRGNIQNLHGAKYILQVNKELSSIDKINDFNAKSLIIAGKSHLGLYTFNEDDYTLKMAHDFIPSSRTNNAISKTTSSSLRRQLKKISTISDVKAGFHNHKNYIAICGTSTSVSIYDITKTSAIDNPLVTSLSEHTRSINSVDFNMSQTNLIVSGGQDGCIKIWDLRSPQITINRSDISINTGSDSVRDVKWMPNYNFGDEYGGSSNRGFKFSSIHDSGLLLKFDMRQPNQVEKKINAHSGPGLCINWHPHQDYIFTGGRDGKLCLWYMGDKSNNGNIVNVNPTNNLQYGANPSYSLSLGSTALAFPELTINTAHPVNKLKFSPKYEKNVFNSLVGTSSMGMDSDVSIYSLARKFIPKNILTLNSPSLGFIWWDDKMVFNIDKQSRISGWNVEQQPTLLDNLPKNAVYWRDLDGDGLLFIDQNPGSYYSSEEMILTPGSSDYRKAQNQHKLSNATANSFLYGNSTNSTNTNNNNNIGNNSAVSLSKSGPHGLPHHHNHIIHYPYQNSLSTERPALGKNTSSFSSKISPSLGSSAWQNMYNLSHHNSIASGSESTLALGADSQFDSPNIVSLDLPHVMSSIRTAKLQELHKMVENKEVLELKSSPTEVFKFLARELKFSYLQERIDTKDIEVETKSQNLDEYDNSKIQLMEKLGLTENNTWANLVRYTKSHESDDSTSESTEPKTPMTSSPEATEKKGTSIKQTEDKGKGAEFTTIQTRLNDLIELITVCDKNSETYLLLEDYTDYKLWLMMRDALLWDLKEISDKLAVANQNNNDLDELKMQQPWTKVDSFSSLQHANRRDSVLSGYSTYSASDLNSSLNTSARRSFNEPKDLLEKPAISHLKAQLEDAQLSKTGSRSNSVHSNLQENLEHLRKLKVERGEDSDSPFDDERDDGEVMKQANQLNTSETKMGNPSENVPPLTKEIEIQNRRPRTSFIDTFISQLRSPGSSHLDSEHESTGSKRSSLPSFGSSAAPFLAKKGLNMMKSSNAKEKLEEGLVATFEPAFENIPLTTVKTNQTSAITTFFEWQKKQNNEVTPPWSTREIILQIYKSSVASGNILLTMNILLLFQNMFNLVDTRVLKNSIAEFTTLLHKYELFEIAAELLKYCPFDDISDGMAGQSSVRMFCDKCGKLLSNEKSKEKYTEEFQSGAENSMSRFGYWYCDNCTKKNTLCCYCNKPMKSLSLCLLNCGHEGHHSCLKKWFLDEKMEGCPAGCNGILL